MKKELLFLIMALCAVCMVSCQQTPKGEMAYPQAEWSDACEILMHTPGPELFNIRLLEKNGIRVYTVEEILKETGIDTLRVLASKVLRYDISAIPGEDAEASELYREQTIREMSRGDLIRCILLQPTVKLSHTDNNTGYEAQYIQNPLMNLYFTRDQSITTPRGHVICKMNSSQRAPETDIIEVCYHHMGMRPILRIEGEGRLEGGDYFPAGTISLIGCGMRTNREGIRQVMAADAFGHDTVVVVRDHKFWQMQMHLDTYFNIIDRDLCTMVRSRLEAMPDEPEYVTCDIYARAAGEKEYRLIIAPRHIMAVGGQSAALQQRLRDAGVKVEWVPLESLIDGYGAAHCMTQVMNRMKH